MEESAGELSLLPEGCIANIISFTKPRDACRLSSVSKIFKLAAESDAVWERFLPTEYPTIISNSTSSSSSLVGLTSKKELYFSLCENPRLIDYGKKSFQLDKHSGKKCYMISSRGLEIRWWNTPEYDWIWSSIPEYRFLSLPESRFPEVAELVDLCWLEIRGKISTRSLSPQTLYTAYFVYKLTEEVGFDDCPVGVSVALDGTNSQYQAVCLDAESWWGHDGNYHKEREDKWLEIELGDFFSEGDEEGELEMSISDLLSFYWKIGFIVQGIEIRPKQG